MHQQFWGAKLKRDYIWGTRTKKIEYHCTRRIEYGFISTVFQQRNNAHEYALENNHSLKTANSVFFHNEIVSINTTGV
jgi:hypothetical protein